MAQIVIDVPDNQVTRVLTAFASVYKYNPASGLTQAQFAQSKIAAFVKSVVVRYETEQAQASNDINVT